MIDEKTIAHVAKLAKLKMSDAEAKTYSEQLSKALSYFQQIESIKTQGVEPLVTPSEVETFWRADLVQKELTAEELTKNAPLKMGNLLKVPPVV